MAIMILNGCDPVKVEGDVFLVKGDGKPQPSAAKEVIFVQSESFEDLLIETYLEIVESDLKSSSNTIKGICDNAREIMKAELSETEALLTSNISEQKASGIIDQNGTCTSFQATFDEAFSAASLRRNNFENQIAEQESIKRVGLNAIKNLTSELEREISERESQLYKDFVDGIQMSIVTNNRVRYSFDRKGVLQVTNNTPYNLKLEKDICLQFYNVEGNPVGESSYNSNGTKLTTRDVNTANITQDEYGFSRGGYLKKGESVRQVFDDNVFPSRNFSASERLKFSKKYGQDPKGWPDVTVADLSKGYDILIPTTYSDDAACDLGDFSNNTEPKFIALEDEVRTEIGDTVTYTSKEVDFRTIAENETYAETTLIEEQELIVEAAGLEINRLIDLSSIDPLIASENDAKALLTQCSNALSDNDLEREFISETNTSLSIIETCSLSDGNIFDALISTSLTNDDLYQLDKLMNKNYSAEATNAMMMKFADSEYKTSTNISGHYVMNEIPKGKYVVYSSYADNFNSGIYINDIEITGEAQIDLSNTKFLSVYSLQSLIGTFYGPCIGTVCSQSDLSYTLGKSIDEAEKSYKDLKESEERLQDSLRELERLLGG